MKNWANLHLSQVSPQSYERFIKIQRDPSKLNNSLELRGALLDFIADFANWDNSTAQAYLQTARSLTQVAHVAMGGAEGSNPLIVDPFAGGGSIPLEALRVGADVFASDLNPVPVLLNKVILEYIPRYGQRLADEVRQKGNQITDQARHRLSDVYASSRERGTVNTCIWARTILSEAPSSDRVPVEVPLIRSMILLNKKGRYTALRWKRDKAGRIKTEVAQVRYDDGRDVSVKRPLLEVFHPKSLAEVEAGTSAGGAATCPITGFTTSVESVREQLRVRKGGAGDARLICVITTEEGTTGKAYLEPTASDLAAADRAKSKLAERVRQHHKGVAIVPDGELNHLRGFFNVVLYGMKTWGDVFSPRQALGLTTLVELIRKMPKEDGESEFGVAVKTCLALALDRCADKCASLVVWDNTRDMATHVFGRQALPMIWDFAEVNLLGDNGWTGALEWVVKVLDAIAASNLSPGVAAQASATRHLLPNDTADAIVTDPPYYAAIPYADLSDFFYSWLKRSIGDLHPDLFGDDLSPKGDECVSLAHRAAMYRHKDSAWFEAMMTKACEEARRIAKPTATGVFVFANKETAGWEAMLGALVGSGWTVTASWPIDTEMGNRLRAQNSAVLASSVHLVCRPREGVDGRLEGAVGDWRDVLAELPRRIEEWMPRLADEGIAGADAIFACLGPALEIFSKYSRVEKANGEQVKLKEYLENVWAAVEKVALNMIFAGADATGFEEDARLTAMWLWTVNAGTAARNGEEPGGQDGGDEDGGTRTPKKAGYVLEYDAARKIAQGLGAHLENLAGLVEVKGEKARLLPVEERARHLIGKEEGKRSGPPKKAHAQRDMFASSSTDGSDGDQVAFVGDIAAKTVLDRVHQSMLLFGTGRGGALKRFLVEEGVGRDAHFWRLAQALSALYPTNSSEKRWVDGVMARKRSLGL